MKALISAVFTLGIGAGIGAVACRDTSGTTTTTGVDLVPNETAAQKITVARCAHEAACHDVGADKKYGTIDVCFDKMKVDVDSRFGECTNGIDANNLGTCGDDIRTEACGNPVDAMSRILSCSKVRLCR